MPINPLDFFKELNSHGVSFFTGVPDSLLKEFCLCIDDCVKNNHHIIAANEGNAVALASGFYLAKQSIPLVYMQNSGLGNAVNPLLSLCDPDVYSIPMLIMIGWRGEPGLTDEPQHTKQGKIQLDFLKSMDIPYEIITKDCEGFAQKVNNAVKIAKKQDRPVVLLIKKGTFDEYEKKIKKKQDVRMVREKALEIILDNLEEDEIIVSTTGKTSREIFEIRDKKKQSHEKDFLTVGSMGHCSSIALGIAIARPNRRVICIDGDGSMLMHMGILATIASLKPSNFLHILINNEVHESVGGQETAAKHIDFLKIIKSIGGSGLFKAEDPEKLKRVMVKIKSAKGPSFIEVNVKPGSRVNLGRPSVEPIENKKSFMAYIDK